MRKRKKMGLLAIAAAVFAGAGTVAQADVIIDTFGGARHSVLDETDDGIGEALSFSDATALLGVRELYVDLDDPTPASSIEIKVTSGLAIEESSPDVSDLPGWAHITWDGIGNDALDVFGLAGLDLSTASENAFYVSTNPAQSVTSVINIEVWDNDSSSNADLVLTAGGLEYSLGFASFTGIDWNNIGAIRMNFLTDNIRIDSFKTWNDPNSPAAPVVPVPAAAWLGFLGMGIVAARRRKQGAKVA